MLGAIVALTSVGGLYICLASVKRLKAISGPASPLPVALLLVAGASVFNESEFETRGRIVVTGVLCVGVAALSIALRWPLIRGERVPARQWLFVLLPMWLFIADAFHSNASHATDVFGRLLPAAVLLSILPLMTRALLSKEQVSLILLFGFGVALSLGSLSSDPWTDCTTFKCGGFGQLFQGAFESGNYLGAVAGIACLASFWCCSPTRSLQIISVALSLLVLYASTSRTSQLALVLGMAALCLSKLFGSGLPRLVRAIAPLVAAAPVCLGIWLVLQSGPSSFSNRGSIWILGREALKGHWLTGCGLTNWTTQVLARNYMHSEMLLLLYGGGVVAGVLYWLVVTNAIASIDADLFPVGIALLAFVTFHGLTEISWNALAFDGSTYLFLPVLLISGIAPGRLRRRSPVERRVLASSLT